MCGVVWCDGGGLCAYKVFDADGNSARVLPANDSLSTGKREAARAMKPDCALYVGLEGGGVLRDGYCVFDVHGMGGGIRR